LDEKGGERAGNDKDQYRKSSKNLDAESFIKAFQKTQFHLFFPNSAIRGIDIFRPPLPDLKSQKHQNSLLFLQLL
jgi:hypothetical protein